MLPLPIIISRKRDRRVLRKVFGALLVGILLFVFTAGISSSSSEEIQISTEKIDCQVIVNPEEKIKCLNAVAKEYALNKEKYESSKGFNIKLSAINQTDDFGLDIRRGFWYGLKAKEHHLYDEHFALGLADFFQKENAHSVADFGAGMGQYSGHLANNGFFVTCIDGNPKTQDLSSGRCAIMDLSKPIRISQHDWVLSLEVGEHLPEEYETIFLENIDRANRFGIILSWAIEGQWGDGHFNNRNNSYIIKRMEDDFRYDFDLEETQNLRRRASFGHLRKTIMVFRKPSQPQPDSVNQNLLNIGLNLLGNLGVLPTQTPGY